jgi:bifunctional DNase/RNase
LEKVELQIIALSGSESQPGNYVVVLEEPITAKKLPIIIGSAEAQAIAVSMEQMQPRRPLTHDLYKSTLDLLQVRCTEVVIHDLKEGIFYSRITLETPDKQLLEIDSRTSDALAVAVRFQCPIYANSLILEDTGFLTSDESQIFADKKGSLAEYSIEELEEILNKVLAKEDFESATKIRDAIAQKKKS